MSSRASLVVALASTIVLGAAPRIVSAQPSADDAAAEALFDEGVAKRNAGDLIAACAKFRRSYQLSPARGTLLNIAECFEAEDKLASAWATYSTLADQAESAGDRDRLAIARGKRTEIEPRLAYVTIVVAVSPPGLEVRRDQSKLPTEEPTPIDAGTHTITVIAPGYRAWTSKVDISNGSKHRIDVPPLEALPPEPPAISLVAPERKAHRHPRATAGLVMIGAGALSATVGLGFGVAAWNAERSAASACDPDLMCTTDGYEALEDAHSHADRADLLIGAGAALAVVGTVLWWTAPDGTELTVTPMGGAGAMGAVVRGTF